MLYCCCFSIQKYYIYIYIPQDFQFYKKKAAVFARTMLKSCRSQTQWNFDQVLKLCQICYMPSTFQNLDRNSILEILCLHFMYLLFERCITGLILVSVLHSFTLCLSLHLVYHFVQSVLLLSAVIFIDTFNHL